MIKHLPVGYSEALRLTLERISPLGPENVPLSEAVGRTAAIDLLAKVDSPSVNASQKDGFAVLSSDIENATSENSIKLKLVGAVSAGGEGKPIVKVGTTVRILTGAKIPEGADTVLAEEYTTRNGDSIFATKHAEAGRNILHRGSDVAVGDKIVFKGQKLVPGQVGLLAAAGHKSVTVFKKPIVKIIATGDEVVAPGQPLTEGKLYASNLVTLSAWCDQAGLDKKIAIVKDDSDKIFNVLDTAWHGSDAIVTSGGAWTGDRDLVVTVLEKLNWEQIFHRIRIGPGKAMGFGILKSKPVFILPGGPPSNLIAFLEITLPGLLKLAGFQRTGLPKLTVKLGEDITGAFADWTQFIFGIVEQGEDIPVFIPLRNISRLRAMAEAQAIAMIPEGKTIITAGTTISVQILN